MAHGKIFALFCVTIISLGLLGCALISEKRWEFRIVGSSPNAQVLLAYDSPEVRQLLADEDVREEDVNRFWRDKHTAEDGRKRIEDMGKHPEQYPPGRSKFLEAMTNMPAFGVPVKSYCSIIQRSKSTCGPTPLETPVYVLIDVTSGGSRGKQGWVCATHVHQLFP